MEKDVNLNNLSPEISAYISALKQTISDQEKQILDSQNKISEKDKEIKAKDAEISKMNEQITLLKADIERQKYVIKKYNLEHFFSKSDNVNIKQKTSGVKSTYQVEKKQVGRKKGSKNFEALNLEELSKENEPITLDIAESLKEKNPNIKLVKVSEDTTFLVKRIAASMKVFKVIMPIYKDENNNMYRAQNDLTPINHSIMHSSLLSDSITMKYFIGIPEYRYAKWLKAEGLPFSQKDLNNWALQCANILEPFYLKIKTLFTNTSENIANIHIDETWLNVISNRQKGRNKSYIFCYSAKCKDGKIPYFEYSETRETESVSKILENYEGTITVDGYAGYNDIVNEKIKRQRCMVHARREFANITKTLDEEQLKTSVAYSIIKKIDEIFHKESEFKDKKLTPDEIKKERNTEEYLRLNNDLEQIIGETECMEGTPLNNAIKYRKNLKGEQWTYLNDGNVELDNNEAERQAKKFVIARKNFLFAKNDDGATASCILMTLIDFAYINDIDPRDYLEFLLDNVSKRSFEELLPRNEEIKRKYKF